VVRPCSRTVVDSGVDLVRADRLGRTGSATCRRMGCPGARLVRAGSSCYRSAREPQLGLRPRAPAASIGASPFPPHPSRNAAARGLLCCARARRRLDTPPRAFARARLARSSLRAWQPSGGGGLAVLVPLARRARWSSSGNSGFASAFRPAAALARPRCSRPVGSGLRWARAPHLGRCGRAWSQVRAQARSRPSAGPTAGAPPDLPRSRGSSSRRVVPAHPSSRTARCLRRFALDAWSEAWLRGARASRTWGRARALRGARVGADPWPRARCG